MFRGGTERKSLDYPGKAGIVPLLDTSAMYSTSRRKHFMDAMNEDPATNAAAKIRRYLNRDLFVDGKNSNGSSP